MKKIVLSAAFIAAMLLGTTGVYAQTPVKKATKTEQTATMKKAKKEPQKACTKASTKKAGCKTPATKAEKKAPKK